jgi:RNA polymerase sigma-70 factor, ECF subfamily
LRLTEKKALEEEFLKAIDEHQGILIKACRMYCSDSEDADDLFQEILYRLWKGWSSFKGDSKLSTWMYRIALNTSITRLRNKSRQPSFLQLGISHNSIAESQHVRIDITFDKALQQAIDTLDKLDKALVLLYLDEKTYKEIAEIMGMSEGNVGVRINRIKKKLKERLTA